MLNMLTGTREAVKVLNNEAVYLSNQSCDYIQAIEYFQRALIIGKAETESSHSNSRAFNQKTLLESDFSATNGKPPLEKKRFLCSREIEPDEGLYSYTKTLAIALQEASDEKSQEDATLDGIICHGFEAVLCFNLGVCYLLSDQGHEATLYFSRTEALLEQTQGSIYNSSSEILVQVVPNNEDAPVTPFRLDTIAVLHNIGLVNFRAGKYEKSLQCYIEAVTKSIAKYEAEDISVAFALNSIGVLLSRTPQAPPSSSPDSTERTYEDAIAALNRSLNIRINILGEDAGSDKDTGTVLNNIGRIHFLLNDAEEALKYHDEAHTVRKLALGEDHVDTGVAAFNIGQCYQALKKPDDAFKHYSIFVKSIFLNLQSLTENIVRGFEHIAVCFHEDNIPGYATPFYELALQSAKRIFGEKDAYVAQILNQRGNMFCELCAWEDSLESYKEGLEIECAVYPCNHPNIATTKENIARVLHEGAQ
jgi:tetratricopeptide (TPR) repeat protein